jgi:hypothetical protein
VTTCLVTLMASVGLGQPAQAAVSLGALAVRGPLGRPAIQQVLEARSRPTRPAWRSAPGERLSGELSVRVHIEANGVPIAASVDRSNVGDRALERCVAAATEAWRLAERNAATLVTFTLRVGRGAQRPRARRGAGHLAGRQRRRPPARVRPQQPARRRAPLGAAAHVGTRSGRHARGGGSQRGARGPSAARPHQPAAALRLGGARGHGRACAWEVLVSLRLGPSGQVNQEPVVQVSGAPPSVTACVAAVLRETRFPQATAETQVVARYRAVPRS